jgi:hypothetical protein
MKNDNYDSLWKHFIKQGIKMNTKATNLVETFKSQTIMLYSIFVHGKDKMDALMEEWKKIKDDDKVNQMIVELQNTKYGYLIEELIFEDVTLKNVLHIIQVCIEIIRKVQYTNDHKLISEFLNDNPQIKIVEL